MDNSDGEELVGPKEAAVAALVLAVVLLAFWIGHNLGKDVAVRDNQSSQVDAAG